ncbi:branched-chain amino acid ABC transporter permease [Haloplanus ruber]|uniref:Branched-chain amino acid ABC transporter permease n=1 Tax=Haloplanus ruber TaxID=869892 RepID=A0ABD6CVJ6_9EURY|nr:branched-chain amino acid ABC transporter permease [Haloplanus ruber]
MGGDESTTERAVGATGVASSLSVSVAGRELSGTTALAALGVGALLFAPAILANYLIQILTLSLIFALFAISVDLLWGYTGILTFGHAVFLGGGAYLMGTLLEAVGTGPAIVYAGLAAGTVLPGLLGLVVAGVLFSRGISEDYFTIITLALAIIAEQIAVSWSSVTNGANGLLVPPARVGIPGVVATELTGVPFYYLCVGVLLAGYLVARRIVDSPFGRALVAINENETKATALGYDTEKYKTLVFGVSSGMAGFAGTLYVLSERFISPPLLGFVQSTDVLIWVLVGGRGTLVGGILGTISLRFFENTISGALAFSWILVLGIVLILIVLLFPEGLVGVVEVARERLRDRRDDEATDHSSDL